MITKEEILKILVSLEMQTPGVEKAVFFHDYGDVADEILKKIEENKKGNPAQIDEIINTIGSHLSERRAFLMSIDQNQKHLGYYFSSAEKEMIYAYVRICCLQHGGQHVRCDSDFVISILQEIIKKGFGKKV